MIDPTKYGFHKGTEGDFMAWAGAEPDAHFRYEDLTDDPEGGGAAVAAIFSESGSVFHLYVHSLSGSREIDHGFMVEGDGAQACLIGFNALLAEMKETPTTVEEFAKFGIKSL